MERLTELNESKTAYFYPQCFDKCGGIGYSRKCDSCDLLDMVCNKLGEYEDLEEHGKLLRLPCKVGDTLYFPYIDDVTKEKVISKEEVTEIGLYYRVGNGELSSCKEIGDIIFTTKEQAKLALKEMEERMSDWNYDMDSCPLDTKVYLLSSNDCPLLPQRTYVGTITHNGRYRTRGECYKGDPDYFYRSAIVAWKEYKEESEDKPMQHNVAITKEESRVIEEYWTLLAMRKEQVAKQEEGWSAIFIGDIIGKSGCVKGKKELDHNPTLQEITQFLSETKADFVSVEHNYRFVDLQDC